MPKCPCGSILKDCELKYGKCEKCRKHEADTIAQQQHDHEQHAKLQAGQVQDEKEQQNQWVKDYEQEMHRQREQQEAPSQSIALMDKLDNAESRAQKWNDAHFATKEGKNCEIELS